MYTLENPEVKATFQPLGAELSSFIQKSSGIEYIWQGDPEFWGRKAPVLFPIVGRLKEDQYCYKGKTYSMTQHGFARNQIFTLEEKTDTSLTFLLTSNNQTREMYPFEFELRIRYTLTQNVLAVQYQVTNPADAPLYFSIGGHPGFNVPLTDKEVFEDYYLHYSPQKSRTRIPLQGAFIDPAKKTLGQTNSDIDLTREWFKQDALIYETRGRHSFKICTDEHDHSVKVTTLNMPYVGIWSPYPKEAPFVCIEPWCGIADAVDSSGELTEKLGINHLPPHASFHCEYDITIR
ncbi:aldose 1-epimerase family protein [Vagococcus humatus]|uniref:aldose 1-epimerase family protein n=1 Tax=Vagococcus humatus TaxID=1889241 RepID=UPI001FB21AB6|nr:aldose 1-epimerase family protein [Vagococcus humatus]